MNKFKEKFAATNKDIKETRAAMASKAGELEANAFVSNLKKELGSLEMSKEDLVDLAPDNKYSLRPGKEFDAASWFKELVRLELAIELKKVEVKVAEKAYDEWFKEEKKD